MTGRRKIVVLAVDAAGTIRGIGPAADDAATVDAIRVEVERRRWQPYGVVPLQSPAAFKRAGRREAAFGATPRVRRPTSGSPPAV